MARTKLQREAGRRAREIRRALAADIRRLREDAGVGGIQLSDAAGLSRGYVARLESETIAPTIEAYTAIAAALGADFSVRIYPNTGPAIRDRFQARMIEALLAVLGPRWRATPEVVVSKPVRGVIDLVLHDPDANIVVAVDAQSELRRLEQQLRWSQEKAAALPSSELWRFADLDTAAPTVSRLLLLRSTRTTRDLTLLAEGALRSAYPARPADAVAALRGDARWPGDAILWVRTHGTQTTVLDRPPRGVSLGR